MIIPEEIKQNIINGLILDSNGCWSTIKEPLIKEKSNKSRSEDSSINSSKKKSSAHSAQTQAYHIKETDKLDTEILKTEEALAKKPKGGLAHQDSMQKDDSTPQQTKPVKADDLETKQLSIKISESEEADTKIMKINKTDIDEFIEDMPRDELEDTSELDSVFSDIMSELDVFSNAEEPTIKKRKSTHKENILTQDKESGKEPDTIPKKKQTLGIQASIDENGDEQLPADDSPPSKVLSDWDKARSKSGKIIFYIFAAGTLIAGIVVIVQILFW
jgi:hypothetical protein